MFYGGCRPFFPEEEVYGAERCGRVDDGPSRPVPAHRPSRSVVPRLERFGSDPLSQSSDPLHDRRWAQLALVGGVRRIDHRDLRVHPRDVLRRRDEGPTTVGGPLRVPGMRPAACGRHATRRADRQGGQSSPTLPRTSDPASHSGCPGPADCDVYRHRPCSRGRRESEPRRAASEARRQSARSAYGEPCRPCPGPTRGTAGPRPRSPVREPAGLNGVT